MKVYWELEANVYNGDNVSLRSGTKRQCIAHFLKMTPDEKKRYFFISLQPYSDTERLDEDEILYINNEVGNN